MFKRRSSKASVSLYVSLGLTRHASQDDIQRAYHILHLKYKQDEIEKKKGAKKKVKKVERAYSILGDPSKRAMYDEHGTIGRWGKIRQSFSPEALDKHSSIVKGLWTFCFAATGCCFCFCCHHCCNTCTPDTCDDHDEDEIYIRNTFPEYLTDSSSPSSSPFGARRRRAEVKQVAMRRRQDRYQKKKDGKMVKRDSGYNDEERKDRQDDENGDLRLGDDQPSKITKRSLISKDSGYNEEERTCKDCHDDNIDPLVDDQPSKITKRSLISKDIGYNEEERKDRHDYKNEDNKDPIGNDQPEPSKIIKRTLISNDSGCDIGLDNIGFINDHDDSMSSSECLSEDHSMESCQGSIELHDSTVIPDNSDSLNDDIDERTE